MIPETQAATRIASLVGTHIDRRYITDLAIQDFATKVVANRGLVRRIFDELDADPKRITERNEVLRQQQTARLEDFDWFMEEAAYHKQAWAEACETAERIRARRLGEHDPDAIAQDREDARAREARHDEQAAQNAPRVAS